VAHGTDVCDFRRSGCRHIPFLRSRKCCRLSYKKDLTGRSRTAADDVNGTGPARRLAWQSRDKRDRRAQSRPRNQSRTTVAIARTTEIGEPAAKLPNHRPPNGKPNALPTAAASAAQRSGSALAECTQEITAAWARYAEEVMRHTSEASQALLRARTFTEIFGGAGQAVAREHAGVSRSERQNCRGGEPHGDTPIGGIEGGEYRAAAKLAAAR